jgi:cytochrome c-type biogenesis protein CcmF
LLGFWVIATTGAALLSAGVGKRWYRLPAGFWGMVIAHAGLGLFIIGVSTVKNASVETDLALGIGERTEVAGFELTFNQLRAGITGVNYDAIEGEFEIRRGGHAVATLLPQKRIYRGQDAAMTEAAIDGRWSRDLFLALGEDLGGGRWSIRFLYKPMIRFIWVGALIIALGGFIASVDRRYRASASVYERSKPVIAAAASRSS